jgi:S1-C subfamily serine protease
MHKVAPSTVTIEAWVPKNRGDGVRAPIVFKASSGSGFIYSAEQGLIMTAHHVTRREQQPPVRFKVVFPSGHVREASYVAGDRELDIALLRIESPRWPIEDDSDRVELIEVERGACFLFSKNQLMCD